MTTALSAHWKAIFARRRPQLPLNIELCSQIALRNIILDVRTPGWILDEIAQRYSDDAYLMQDLVCCPNLPETTLAFIALTGSEEIKQFISGRRSLDLVMGDGDDAGQGEKKKLNVQQLVNRMTAPQKIKLALSGGKDARTLLIRESNKQIALSVLENPRLTDGEVEFFAQSQNLGEDVMRKIASHSEWPRKYSIAQSLVFNPKTPPGLAMGFVSRMHDRELGLLEKSRNVSEAVRSAARQLIMKRKSGKK